METTQYPMLNKNSAQYRTFLNVLTALPILVLFYLVSGNPIVQTNLQESYKMLETQLVTYIGDTPTLSIKDLALEGDKFNKRKVKRFLQDAFQSDNILHLHTTSIDLMDAYPKHESKIQKLTIRVANENGYSLRFHPDDRSIIYRKLSPKELEKIRAEDEMVEEITEVPLFTKNTEEESNPLTTLSVKAFPNPTAENITITFLGTATPAVLTILTIQGKEVYREQIQPTNNRFNRTIPIHNLLKGMATIRIEQKGRTVQQKVIVID